MDRVTLLDRARHGGLAILLDGDRLVVRGPKRLETLAREVLAHKAAVVAALEAEVAWRAEAMRGQVQAGLPLRFLAACAVDSNLGSCLSCGDPVAELYGVRCAPCREAAWRVVRELHPEVSKP